MESKTTAGRAEFGTATSAPPPAAAGSAPAGRRPPPVASVTPRSAQATRRAGLLLLLLAALAAPAPAQGPPLLTEIQSPGGETVGEARVYRNYVEIADAGGTTRGAVGVVLVDGRARLFLIQADQSRTLIGWAASNRLFNAEGELAGFYYWTPTHSYVYTAKMEKLGQARCLAYQGVCAAAVAGYLLGLL